MIAETKLSNLTNETADSSFHSKMTLKELVAQRKEELQEEAKEAERLWRNKKSAAFIDRLIKHGDLQAAKDGRSIPDPTPMESAGNNSKIVSEEIALDTTGNFSTMEDLIRFAAQCSKTNEDTIFFRVRWGEQTFARHDEDYINDELSRSKSKPTVISAKWRCKGAEKPTSTEFELEETTKEEVEDFFGLRDDIVAVKTFLDAGLVPLKEKDTKSSLNIAKVDTSFVETDPPDAVHYFRTTRALDKSYVIVVTGESGSGKSVFACQQALDLEYYVLYQALTADIFKTAYPNPKKQFPALNALLQSVIDDIEEKDDLVTTDQDDLDVLFDLKKQLKISRNSWARSVFKAAIDSVKARAREVDAADKWLSGRWKSNNKPDNVAIVIDEATDIDLVSGLIAVGQEIMGEYSYLARHGGNVQLVLAGVGLDAIEIPDRVGTNPKPAKLVTMKGPIVEKVIKREIVSEEVQKALERGVFARVLKTNTRMFFRSVLPILQLDVHVEDAEYEDEPDKKKARLEDRLVEVGSFRALMDHAPRFYVTQNTVGDLQKKGSLNGLLLQSFSVHLIKSMESHEPNDEVLKENWEQELALVRGFKCYKDFDQCSEHHIYSKGLASRHGTSNALKFLACFGLTCQLRATFGDEFEEMTALHFMRYMQTQGYEPRRVILKHAWPPKRTKGDIAGQITRLGNILEEQGETEKECLLQLQSQPAAGQWCYLFSQGTASAQGGHVLALILDMRIKEETGELTGIGELETIQCKHFASSPSPKVCRGWWHSLGVDFDENGDFNLSPERGSAGYSYMGLTAFRKVLSQWLPGVDIKIGKRTLALSFETPSSFPIPKSESCRAWFREMFAPTISVLPLKEATECTDEER